MADLNTVKNCSNFTKEEIKVIALARGVSAAVCCHFTYSACDTCDTSTPQIKKMTVWNCYKMHDLWGHCSECGLYQVNFALQSCTLLLRR